MASVQWRRSRQLDQNTRLTTSLRGATVSRRVGPLTVSSSGRVTLRLGKGLSIRLR